MGTVPLSTHNRVAPAPDYPPPRIIPRSEHPISRKNIDKEALKVLYRLRDAGFKGYLVGGGVRDLLLGKVPKDFDISTDARPGELRKLFRNSRLIGRRFRLVQVFFHGNKIIEVSTFRRRSEFDSNSGKDEVLASNNTYGTPTDDAFRRDLTINALCYEIETFSVIDYTGGVEDLHQGIIRVIGDPDRRITRDPARMLRALRHAARNNFVIEDQTWQAIKRHCQEINLCPVSRVRDELFKDLRGGCSRAWMKLALDSGILQAIFPFYRTSLTAAEETATLLAGLLAVVDRLHQKKQAVLADHFLLALVMLPWTMHEFDLNAMPPRGPEQQKLSRAIRARLDEALNSLNIKKGMKEAMTTLLATVGLFRWHEKGGWPQGLKRKSYFKECEQFYRIYHEARGGRPTEMDAVIAVAAKPMVAAEPVARKQRKARGGRPAFAAQSQGGIFGLRRSGGKKK